MNREELEQFYDEVYQDCPERLVLFCENCKKGFIYKEFANGCCPNCGKQHSEYRPKKKICEECGEKNKLRDNYCKYCGALLGKEFIPYLNENDCIYGPPPFRTDYVCKHCGHKWSGLSNESYCPKCGKDNLDKYLAADDNYLKFLHDFWDINKEDLYKRGYKAK